MPSVSIRYFALRVIKKEHYEQWKNQSSSFTVIKLTKADLAY